MPAATKITVLNTSFMEMTVNLCLNFIDVKKKKPKNSENKHRTVFKTGHANSWSNVGQFCILWDGWQLSQKQHGKEFADEINLVTFSINSLLHY